jgi:hypothetical protein
MQQEMDVTELFLHAVPMSILTETRPCVLPVKLALDWTHKEMVVNSSFQLADLMNIWVQTKDLALDANLDSLSTLKEMDVYV